MISHETYRRSIRYFLDPISSLLEDPSVTEVMVNGPSRIYFERGGRLHESELTFASASLLRAAARNIAEFVDRPLDEAHPSLDARLPDGERVHVILPPASRQGICMSIRKFSPVPFDLEDLVGRGSLTDEVAEFLRIAVRLRKTIVISGATGTGKTSFLNAVAAAIPDDERIIVIEESSELALRQPHALYLESRLAGLDGLGEMTIRQLFVESLRMRPDRILVGEVRRGEALDLIQAMISGHSGTLTTVHAQDCLTAAIRLETMCMMSGVSLPAHVARLQVAQAVNLVVQLSRDPDGTRRVWSISELDGLDPAGNYRARDLYRFRAKGRDGDGTLLGALLPTNVRPTFASEPYELGFGPLVDLTRNLFEAPPETPGPG